MTKLTILRGISGSGKTTHAEKMQAENPRLVIVERDRLRLASFSTEDVLDEEFITMLEYEMVRLALESGRSVVVSNTNTRIKYVNALVAIANEADVPYEVIVMDVPLDKCLENNRRRGQQGGRFVPERVIRQQHQTFESNKDVKFA